MDNNEKYLRKNIGRKIKLARSRTNYTQEKLAEKLSLSTRYIISLINLSKQSKHLPSLYFRHFFQL